MREKIIARWDDQEAKVTFNFAFLVNRFLSHYSSKMPLAFYPLSGKTALENMQYFLLLYYYFSHSFFFHIENQKPISKYSSAVLYACWKHYSPKEFPQKPFLIIGSLFFHGGILLL